MDSISACLGTKDLLLRITQCTSHSDSKNIIYERISLNKDFCISCETRNKMISSGIISRNNQECNVRNEFPLASKDGFTSHKKEYNNYSMHRRDIFSIFFAGLFTLPQFPALAFSPVEIDLTKEPSGKFDANDERLREAAKIFENALSANSVEEEEHLWTEIIDKCRNIDADWVNDILSRAYGNRGNARSRQGKFDASLEDFSKSIDLAPYAVDPVLNRGVILENIGRYDEAASDYRSVLKVAPNDPAAWNNLGNVTAALGNWDEALLYYQKAFQLAPEFSFAAANYALALYQVGKENEAIKRFRTILRKYPEFPDVRAALAVSLYQSGLFSDAETNWIRLEDLRYKDRSWVKNTRRWPPKLVTALESFLDVRTTS